MTKITINGKEYDFNDPEELKKMIAEHKNEWPGGDKFSVFTANNIVAGDKVYNSMADLPPETKALIQQKLKNNPFAQKILKMYGMNIDNLENSFNNNAPLMSANDSPIGSNYQSSDPFKNNNSSNSPFGPQKDPFASQGKNHTGLIITLVALLGMGGFTAFMIFGMNLITSGWEETFALTGDPTHFDPLASVEEIRSHIDPSAKLNSIDISHVRSDGTMDLTAKSYRPTADYEFYIEVPTPKDAPPVGAGGTKNGKWYEKVSADVYEPGQWRHVMKIGGGVSTEYDYMNKGIDLDRDDPTATPDTMIADPKCSTKDLWKIAMKKGAPAEAVADIDYDDNGYRFYISNADINLDFGMDCKLKNGDETPVVEAPQADEPTDPLDILN